MPFLQRQSLYFTAPHQVKVLAEPMPSPGVGEVLVQTAVSAISSGSELLLYRGQFPQELAVDETISALAGTFVYPLKYGYAAVGRVVELGSGVESAWLGRLVFAFNPHESHFVAQTAHLLPVPDGLAAETAVFLPNMETAVSFLMDGGPMIGEQVVVFGQGVVGLLTTLLLAQLPLAALVTVEAHVLRRQWSRQLGAQAAIDPTLPDAVHHIQTALQGKRPYAGADLTFELSGNPAALDMAIAVTGYNGRLLVGSWYGRKRADLNLGGWFHRSHMRLISSQVSQLDPQWNGRWSKNRRLGVAWEMLARHQPAHLVTHRFPLAQAVAAYDLLDKNPAEAGQVLLVY